MFERDEVNAFHISDIKNDIFAEAKVNTIVRMKPEVETVFYSNAVFVKDTSDIYAVPNKCIDRQKYSTERKHNF